MTHLHGNITLLPGQRLFEPMRKLCITMDAIHIAISVVRFNRVGAKMGDYVSILSAQFPLEIRLPSVAPMISLVHGSPISHIEINFSPVTKEPNYQATITGTASIIMGLITPIYVDFYEHYRQWIGKFGDIERWPEIFRFAWAIRNAISHHGGRIHITDSKRRPVRWHNLTYDYRDAGREVVGIDLSLGDMIILMFELAEQLDALGCPLDP